VTIFFGHHNVLSPKLTKLQQIHKGRKVMCLWIDNMVVSFSPMNSMHFVNSLELQSISQMFKKKKYPSLKVQIACYNMLIFQMHYGQSNCNNLSYIVQLFSHKCSFKKITLYELWHWTKSNVIHRFEFLVVMFISMYVEIRRKINSKNQKCILLGIMMKCN
jgi:hypothetical protein